jgi:hypothetical protein
MTWIRRGSRDGGDPGHCAVTDTTRRKVFGSADIFDCHANRRSACRAVVVPMHPDMSLTAAWIERRGMPLEADSDCRSAFLPAGAR